MKRFLIKILALSTLAGIPSSSGQTIGRGIVADPSWVQKYSGSQACRIYGAATYSFLWTTGKDLSSYAGTDAGSTPYKVVLTDGSAKTATGYFGAQGAGETLGSEVLTNYGFETGANTGYVSEGGFTINITSTNPGEGTYSGYTQVATWDGIYQKNLSLTTNALYKSFGKDKRVTGSSPVYDSNNFSVYGKSSSQGYGTDGTGYFWESAGATYDVWLTSTARYFVSIYDYTSVGLYKNESSGTSILYADAITCKPVTDGPATYSLHVMTAKNGTTRGWTVDSGFNYNAATHTVTIYHWE